MDRIKLFRTISEDMLTQRILPFWLKLRDNKNGGFFGRANTDGSIDQNASKGVILHSRILYTFSEAYRLTGKDEYLSAADHAYDFLVLSAMDKEYGGLYWSLHANGMPCEPFKHCYNQAFGVYAFATYYLASGKKEARDKAMELFALIENKWFDGIGYLEKLSVDFSPMKNEELSENNIIAERTMNTMLHLMEAYTVLYRATESPEVLTALIFTIRQLTNDMYNPKKERLEVFFDIHFRSLLDLQSYGHDIEASWLIDRAIACAGDKMLQKSIAPITEKLYSSVMSKAYTDRGVFYECENGINNTRRDWWVQAEAIVGIVNHMGKSGDKKEHLGQIERILAFINSEMVHPSGEWICSVYEDGSHGLSGELAGPWKCPYHNARMCMEIMMRLK